MGGLHALQESSDLLARHEGAGGIVRVGDEDHAGVVGNGVEHRVQVMAVVLGRHHDVARARLRGQPVDGEGMLRVHGRGARLQQRQRHDFRMSLEPLPSVIQFIGTP